MGKEVEFAGMNGGYYDCEEEKKDSRVCCRGCYPIDADYLDGLG